MVGARDVREDPGARSASTLDALVLRSIVDHAIVTLDPAGTVTSWNEGAERILGWSEAEIVGRSADLFFTDADSQDDRLGVEMRIARDDGRAEDVRWHVRKDGRKFWASGLMMPLLDGTNDAGEAVRRATDVSGYVKIFRDRTYEHETGNRIALLEDRAALAMRRFGTVGVFEIDTTTSTVVTDGVYAALHGVPAEAAERGIAPDVLLDGIHPEDAPAARLALERAFDDGTDVDVTYRTAQDGLHPRWVHVQGVVQRDDEGRPSRLTGIVVDITEQQQASRFQDAQLRLLDDIRDLRDPAAVATAAARTIARMLYATHAGYGVIGADDDTIDILGDWNADGSQSIVGELRYSEFGTFLSILREGRPLLIEDAESEPTVPDASALAGIGIRSLINLPLMDDGRLHAVLFVNDVRPRRWSPAEVAFVQSVLDRIGATIERLRSDGARDMMAAEMAHRMKNMLTIAQVVVTQSLRNVDGIDAEREAISGRLRALSDAQDVLTRFDDRDVGIDAVVEAALRPYRTGTGRIAIEGPAVELTSQRALGLALALHELATNALKYGALSDLAGRVAVRWSVQDGAFRFAWTESDGPTVATPTSRGFGSTILDRVVGSYFNGTARVEYAAAGMAFVIEGRL